VDRPKWTTLKNGVLLTKIKNLLSSAHNCELQNFCFQIQTPRSELQKLRSQLQKLRSQLRNLCSRLQELSSQLQIFSCQLEKPCFKLRASVQRTSRFLQKRHYQLQGLRSQLQSGEATRRVHNLLSQVAGGLCAISENTVPESPAWHPAVFKSG